MGGLYVKGTYGVIIRTLGSNIWGKAQNKVPKMGEIHIGPRIIIGTGT